MDNAVFSYPAYLLALAELYSADSMFPEAFPALSEVTVFAAQTADRAFGNVFYGETAYPDAPVAASGKPTGRRASVVNEETGFAVHPVGQDMDTPAADVPRSAADGQPSLLRRGAALASLSGRTGSGERRAVNGAVPKRNAVVSLRSAGYPAEQTAAEYRALSSVPAALASYAAGASAKEPFAAERVFGLSADPADTPSGRRNGDAYTTLRDARQSVGRELPPLTVYPVGAGNAPAELRARRSFRLWNTDGNAFPDRAGGEDPYGGTLRRRDTEAYTAAPSDGNGALRHPQYGGKDADARPLYSYYELPAESAAGAIYRYAADRSAIGQAAMRTELPAFGELLSDDREDREAAVRSAVFAPLRFDNASAAEPDGPLRTEGNAYAVSTGGKTGGFFGPVRTETPDEDAKDPFSSPERSFDEEMSGFISQLRAALSASPDLTYNV